MNLVPDGLCVEAAGEMQGDLPCRQLFPKDLQLCQESRAGGMHAVSCELHAVSCERAHSVTLPDTGQGARGPEAGQGAREWDELRVKEEPAAPMFGSKGGDRGFWVPPGPQKVLYVAILVLD